MKASKAQDIDNKFQNARSISERAARCSLRLVNLKPGSLVLEKGEKSPLHKKEEECCNRATD